MADAAAPWATTIGATASAFLADDNADGEELLLAALDLGAPWDVATAAAARALAGHRARTNAASTTDGLFTARLYRTRSSLRPELEPPMTSADNTPYGVTYTNPSKSWQSRTGEGVEGGDEPVPAAEPLNAVGVGGGVGEVGVGDGLLVGDAGVGAALDAAAELLEDALGFCCSRAGGRVLSL